MKRNSELDKAYETFIEDLILLMKETRSISEEKTETIKGIDIKINKMLIDKNLEITTSQDKQTLRVWDKAKKEAYKPGEKKVSLDFKENPRPLAEHATEMRRVRRLVHNANFLYCFALFENYASKVVKINFQFGGQSPDSPREKYMNRFSEFAKKSSEKKDHRFTDMLRFPPKMIANYDELPETINLWTYMLGIDKKGVYKNHIFRYTEARERRNLLIHRSTYCDTRYKDSFKRSHMKPDKGKAANKFLDHTLKKFSTKVGSNIDLSVTPQYLNEVFEMFMAMSSLLYMYSFKPNKDDSSIFPNSTLHNLMNFTSDYTNLDGHPALMVLCRIIREYKSNCVKNNWKNVPDLDKLNLLIMIFHLKDELNSILHFLKKPKDIDFVNDQINVLNDSLTSLHKKIIPTMRKDLETKALVNLLDCHIKGNIKGVIKNLKNMKLSWITYQHTQEWFMFKQYKENKEFIKYCDSLDTKKDYIDKSKLKDTI